MISIFTTLKFALLAWFFIKFKQIVIKLGRIKRMKLNFNQIMSAARSYSIETESRPLNITQFHFNLLKLAWTFPRIIPSKTRAFSMQTPVIPPNNPLASSGIMLGNAWAFPAKLSSFRSCFYRAFTPLLNLFS